MSRIRVIPGLVVALGLAACSSDFTSSGDPLTDTEASDLAGIMVNDGFAGFGGFSPAAAQPAPAHGQAPADNITIAFDESGPCEGGGSVALAGSLNVEFDEQSEEGSLNFEYTLTPAACVVTAENGKVFTLTGDPNIEADGELELSATGLAGSLNYNGKFEWSADDGRSGVCGIDLSAEYEFAEVGEGSAGSISVEGEVCGVSVNRSLDYEDDA
jgi:hypothetical protein